MQIKRKGNDSGERNWEPAELLGCKLCVFFYQPWPSQNEEFPEMLRKVLSHIQGHRRASQKTHCGKNWWIAQQGQRQRLPLLPVWNRWQTLETRFPPSPHTLRFFHYVCRKDEVSVWNVWVRRKGLEEVDREQGRISWSHSPLVNHRKWTRQHQTRTCHSGHHILNHWLPD